MDDALGCLILAVIFFPIVLVIGVLWFIFEHADEIAEIIAEIAKGVWAIHKFLGRALLWIVRDLPVYLLATDKWQDRSVRTAVILWLSAIPLTLLFTLWFLLAAAVNTQDWAFALFLFAPSIIGIGIGYFLSYFEHPVQHHRWPRFMAQPYLMKAEGQLAYIDHSLAAKFWMAEKKQAVGELLTKDN